MIKFLQNITIVASALVIAAVLGIVADYPVHQAKGQSTFPGPNVYAYTAVTTAQVIIGANPSRHALQILSLIHI